MSGSNSNALLDSIAHPAQINLLGAYHDAASTANAIWQNRSNQANALRGQLLQQATDPDGNVNMLRYNQLASQAGPGMALAMPAGVTQSTEIAGQQQTQALKSLTAQSTALDSLGPNATYEQVRAKLAEGMSAGWLQQAGARSVLVGMPQGDDPQSQATRSHILQTIGDQVRTASERLQSQYGTQGTTTGPGGQLIGVNQNQRSAAVSAPSQPGVQTGPDAGTLSGVSTITGPDGSSTTDTLAGHQKAGRVSAVGGLNPGYSAATASPAMVTALRGQEGTPDGRTSVAGARGQMQVTPGFFKQYAQPGESFDSKADVEAVAKRGIAALEAKYPNDPGRVATAYFSGEGNVAPAGSKTPYISDTKDANGASTSAYAAGVTGRYNPGMAASAASGTKGPAPGVVEAAKDTATQSAAMGSALTVRADAVPTNKANYGTMLADLSKLNTMGPGTDRETAINGFIQKLTGYGVTMDRNQVAGAESFAKVANMIAAQQLGSLGPTDARQSLAMGANPHLDLSKLGNEQIIHMLQGNEDAINAKSRAWQKWTAPTSQGGLGNNAGSYGQFSNDFNHNFDPRVFQQQYMSKKEIADLRTSLSGPGEAAKFRHDFTYAQDQGWIK